MILSSGNGTRFHLLIVQEQVSFHLETVHNETTIKIY